MERKLWTPEEDQVITSLVNNHGKKKWTLIADEMQKIYPRSCRTSKQIRQRWHNHLDPEVSKEPWTTEEQNILFEAHRRYGNKWKEIAAQLQRRRTDNYVKNHFYSTLRRSLRRINKYLGFKNSTNQMRSIRPSILSYLLDLSENDPECRILVSSIFQFSHFKPSKTSQCEFIEECDKEKYQSAITKLIEINQTYTKQKSRKRGKNQLQMYKNVQSEKEQNNEVLTEKHVQEEKQEEEGMDGSWNDSPIHDHYKYLRQIEVPEYQCELLERKVDEDVIMHEQSQMKIIQAINLFNP